jgi:hypothetical protein
MEEFPSNSKNVTGTEKSTPLQKPSGSKPEKKDIQKVITGEAVKKPSPLGRRFKHIFFGTDIKSVSRYVFGDVLLPAAKNMLVDATSKGVERLIYGDSSPRRPRMGSDANRPMVQYNSPINRSRAYSSARLPDQPPLPNRGRANRYDTGDILVQTRDDAELVVERMQDIIDKYQVATVADLQSLIGYPSTYVDNEWGWSSLQTVNIQQTRNGYVIELPQAEPIS